METGPGNGASILNLPHDTEARTLLAWPRILSGLPWLHEQPLRSYGKPSCPAGEVREVMHPANHPHGHTAVRVGDCILAAQEAREN